MEATGINHFITDAATALADLGFVVIIPDCYRAPAPPRGLTRWPS